jgi:HK97 family phage major capsid protein
VKSDLTVPFGRDLGTPGVKSLLDYDSPYTSIPMDPTPYRIEPTPTSFLEILPAIQRGVVYRYMRQTVRSNNAAPVAPGGLKPTSTYALSPVDGRLHVIAHVSDPMDKYVLSDGPSLTQFVQLEMVEGLHPAVEGQLLNGDGTGENLRGIANTSGIQTQPLVSDAILTARSAITKVEVLGFTPYYFVMNPLDWQAVETTQLAQVGVLNREGSRNGLPVDMAARSLSGVPVTVTTGVPCGTGYLLSSGVAQVATDGHIDTEWSSAINDDFGRNQVRLRVEGRFDLAVTHPSAS